MVPKEKQAKQFTEVYYSARSKVCNLESPTAEVET